MRACGSPWPEGPSPTTTPSTVHFPPSSLTELVTETGPVSPLAQNHPALLAPRFQPARCCASAWSLHSLGSSPSGLFSHLESDCLFRPPGFTPTVGKQLTPQGCSPPGRLP